MSLPTDYAERKTWQMWTFLTEYFPAAFEEVVRVAIKGNEQHNKGQPLHWAREKSTDQMNTAFRHMWDHATHGAQDTDGCYHLAKAIWRLSAELQLHLEKFLEKSTSAERDAGVQPEKPHYPPGDARRYGAVGDSSPGRDGLIRVFVCDNTGDPPLCAVLPEQILRLCDECGGAILKPEAVEVPKEVYRFSDAMVSRTEIPALEGAPGWVTYECATPRCGNRALAHESEDAPGPCVRCGTSRWSKVT